MGVACTILSIRGDLSQLDMYAQSQLRLGKTSCQAPPILCRVHPPSAQPEPVELLAAPISCRCMTTPCRQRCLRQTGVSERESAPRAKARTLLPRLGLQLGQLLRLLLLLLQESQVVLRGGVSPLLPLQLACAGSARTSSYSFAFFLGAWRRRGESTRRCRAVRGRRRKRSLGTAEGGCAP